MEDEPLLLPVNENPVFNPENRMPVRNNNIGERRAAGENIDTQRGELVRQVDGLQGIAGAEGIIPKGGEPVRQTDGHQRPAFRKGFRSD